MPISLSPDQIDKLHRSFALLQQKRPADANTLIQPLARQCSRDPDVQYVHGLVLRDLGDLNGAHAAMATAVALRPDHPPSLNGFANLLAQRGHYADALATFDRLLSIDRKSADGWLNKALTEQEAGHPDRALMVYDAGLAQLPGNARLMAGRAAVLKEVGDLPASIAAFEQAVVADPQRALLRHNYGVALRAAGRFEAACEQYRQAQALGLGTIELATNWAAAMLEAGHVDQARDLYRHVLKKAPEALEAHTALTRLLWEYDTRDDAFEHIEAAARAAPNNVALWQLYASLLSAYGRQEEAAAAIGEALRNNDAEAELLIAAATILSDVGDLANAQTMFEQVLAKRPDDAAVRVGYARHLLRRGAPQEAEAEALLATKLAPDDQSGWAYLGTAWRMLGDEREFWLHDYDRFVAPVMLPPGNGDVSVGMLAARMRAAVLRHHQTRRHPGGQSLRHGSQTSGDIFARDDWELAEFREILCDAVDRYTAKLPTDPGHPFLRRNNGASRFSGAWSVRLFASGHHVAHIHPQGWISSACYLGVPPAVSDSAQPYAGWIEFGALPADLGLEIEARRRVRPEPGMLVLFPSSMWHGTVPFDDSEPRVTLAFDAVPA